MSESFILISIKVFIIEKGLAKAFLIKKLLIYIPTISIVLASFVLVKHGRGQSKKYSKQVNIIF